MLNQLVKVREHKKEEYNQALNCAPELLGSLELTETHFDERRILLRRTDYTEQYSNSIHIYKSWLCQLSPKKVSMASETMIRR